MADTNLRQADAKVVVEGYVSEKDLNIVRGDDGINSIRGSLTVKTSEDNFVRFSVICKEKTNRGTENKAYAGLVTVMNEYKSIADVGAEEADYINKQLKRGSLKAGLNNLDPEQTLMYARIRKVGNADYQRTERQRIVLQTAFAKLRQSDIRTIINVANDILPNFTTDLTNKQIMGYIYTVVIRNMSINRDTFRLPIDGSFSSERIRGMAVLVPDLERNREALVYYLYGIGQ